MESELDIFISYSSKNWDFVWVLCKELREKNLQIWIDWENISTSAEWMQKVIDGIVAAHTFIFVISPDSVMSEHCCWELDQAKNYNRRLIPICYEQDFKSEYLELLGLSRLNYCRFTPVQDNGTLDLEALGILLDLLHTNLDDSRQYNQLFTKAYEWDTKHRPKAKLMLLPEYKVYDYWLQTRQANNRYLQLENLHPLQQDYLDASYRAILPSR